YTRGSWSVPSDRWSRKGIPWWKGPELDVDPGRALGSPSLWRRVMGDLAQRPLVEATGVAGAPQLRVHVPQMLEDLSLVRLAFDRALQGGARIVQPPHLEQDPTIGIEKRSVLRLQVERMLDLVKRLVQVLAMLGLEIPDVIP